MVRATNPTATTNAINDLIKSLERNTKANNGLLNPLETFRLNFTSNAPVLNGINGMTTALANSISPFKALTEGFVKAEELQKKALALNTNQLTFIKNNTESLNKLRGGFFENAEELFANFEDGIRFNSDSLFTLQNRMKLTGQSTDQLRKTTKLLLGVTNNDIEAIGRLASTNQDLGRTYMVSNEKLLQALDRNAEILDFDSLFGQGEQTSKAITELTARLTSKGVAVDKQQTIIKFLGDQSLEAAQMRQRLGISVDVLDKIATGQTSLDTVLGQINSFASQNLKVTQGSFKKIATNIALEGLGQGIKEVVIASNQIGAALQKPNTEEEKLRSKEDRYYDTFETSVKESKKFYEQTASEFYDVMKPTPDILRQIQIGMAVAAAADTAGQIINMVSEFRSMRGMIGKQASFTPMQAVNRLAFKFNKAQLPATGNIPNAMAKATQIALPNILKGSVKTATSQASNIVNQTAKNATSRLFGAAGKSTLTQAAKVATGSLTRMLPSLLGTGLRFLGPVGFLAGTFGPVLFDLLTSTKKRVINSDEATAQLSETITKSNAAVTYLGNIVSNDANINKERGKVTSTINDQLGKINELRQTLAQEGNKELLAEFEFESNQQLIRLNKIANEAKKTTLNQGQLQKLYLDSSNASEDFYKTISKNTNISAEKLAILAKPKEEERDSKVKKDESLAGQLTTSLGAILTRSLPKKDDSTDKLLKALEDLQKTANQTLDTARRANYAGGR